MRTDVGHTIYRQNWQPYPYLIERVALHFELAPAITTVTTCFTAISKNADPQPLLLDGEGLTLLSLRINGKALDEAEYKIDATSLTVYLHQHENKIEIVNTCTPDQNTTLMGLYVSGEQLFTQCEPEGFRRITWFADRPDVMARYHVTLTADKSAYPSLLSNGNLLSTRQLDGNKHEAVWEDPFPKPSYLFAVVAGDFDCQERTVQTASGRSVLLQVYSDKGDGDKTEWAMDSLERSLRWDENRFGLELDLDRYMIVAAHDFNMGAMENKGLNVFNAAYVLADPQTTTDASYRAIEAVIGHEYFHNWTGNRVTCRDWFQLSLKEGLTVFREQEFSADMLADQLEGAQAESAKAVKRIDDVSTLRLAQFPEDAGPMAHPIRPESYEEISNFYTATIYEKGAEVIRMQHTLLGEALFQEGIREYFGRHDGQAVTCDDFVDAMDSVYQSANPGKDLSVFRRWYSQAGTPQIHIDAAYSPETKTYTVRISQQNDAVGIERLRDSSTKQPLLIPVKVGLIGPEGEALSSTLEGKTADEFLLELDSPQNSWVFHDVAHAPVLSVLRDFSAPVSVFIERSTHELRLLAEHDSNAFGRWEAAQSLSKQAILSASLEPGSEKCASNRKAVEQVYRRLLSDDTLSEAFLSRVLGLASVREVQTLHRPMQPIAVANARQALQAHLGKELAEHWLKTYHSLNRPNEAYSPDALSAGRRALKNLCLQYLTAANVPGAYELAMQQYHQAQNMTDRFSALQSLVNYYDESQSGEACAHFYERWQHDPLVVDKWFSLQACAPTTTVQSLRSLMLHPAFTIRNPNRTRALIFQFCNNNSIGVHNVYGYEFWAEQVVALDKINPEIAARLARAFDNWSQYDVPYRSQLYDALCHIQAHAKSANVAEIVNKALTI
ncbi:aminopeptidase N [Paenalcaligenes niemegkensis]|uniref:aminopeptidase N n=1 Tax=Paenalcaligenes niemegkensis TaxID=2895469 RepID=UPI001EE948D6|nr:aminopeptidase N [Paenalcaligenes niemegkensis]MCQ9616827.1 aminopeptidase N [Paenalcaligenes niemegkensis]